MPNRMDSIISKGTGAVKGVEARLHGLGGVFKTLSEQHGEVSALLRRVKRDPAKRAELWPKIRQELVSHEKAELREVYPVLREYDPLRVVAERHEAEAGQLSAMVDRIHATEISTTSWGQMFDELVEMVEQHVRLEENEIFPRAQEAIGSSRAKELDARFLTVKKQLAMAL
ncbi:MAG TPA: hemerythrin domain-containing protein [Kofleriaceae bacterium]|nr:hemerythrin domain-containing protein [Kofleriaceae bacterium]